MSNKIRSQGGFLVRKTSDGRTIFAGTLNDKDIADDEIWLCAVTIIPVAKYKTSEYMKGQRLDQIFCSSIDVNELEEIPIVGVQEDLDSSNLDMIVDEYF